VRIQLVLHGLELRLCIFPLPFHYFQVLQLQVAKDAKGGHERINDDQESDVDHQYHLQLPVKECHIIFGDHHVGNKNPAKEFHDGKASKQDEEDLPDKTFYTIWILFIAPVEMPDGKINQVQDHKCLNHDGPSLCIETRQLRPVNKGTANINIAVYDGQQEVEQQPCSNKNKMDVLIKAGSSQGCVK
jgi:hypothetical protein